MGSLRFYRNESFSQNSSTNLQAAAQENIETSRVHNVENHHHISWLDVTTLTNLSNSNDNGLFTNVVLQGSVLGHSNLGAEVASVEENAPEINDRGENSESGSDPQVWQDGESTNLGSGGGPEMQYSVNENPPWYLSVLLAFQHFLTMLGACLSIPLVLAPALCVYDNTLATAKILATQFVACGLTTFAQTTFGVRLPVVEGGSLSHLVPALAILSLNEWKCSNDNQGNPAVNQTTAVPCDVTQADCYVTEGVAYSTEEAGLTLDSNSWQSRLRELQGAIIFSSLIEVFIGLFGLVGVLLRYIGPLSIAPTVALVGISLFQTASTYCASNWWIAFLTMALVAVFSQYLRDVNVPCIGYKNRSFKITRFKLFSLFPVVLSIVIAWIVCLILTVTNAVPNDPNHWAYRTRTDIHYNVLQQSKWFDVPYPLQWGRPTYSTASVVGMCSGILAAVVETIGGYYACARLSGSQSPPVHAINRGIFVEGIGNVVSGMLGSGTGLTVYTENVAAIGITQVASRRVIQFTGILLILFGVLGKVAALFVAIPTPVVGGVFMIMFGVITAVGVSNLQFVDLNSTRNLFVFGVSLLLGISLPQWLKENSSAVHTGVSLLDQMVTVLCKTPMFVGGSVAIILDNTIPGTDEERGLIVWMDNRTTRSAGSPVSSRSRDTLYDLPLFSDWFHKHSRWFRYIPICPSFNEYGFLIRFLRRCLEKLSRINPLRKCCKMKCQDHRNGNGSSTSNSHVNGNSNGNGSIHRENNFENHANNINHSVINEGSISDTQHVNCGFTATQFIDSGALYMENYSRQRENFELENNDQPEEFISVFVINPEISAGEPTRRSVLTSISSKENNFDKDSKTLNNSNRDQHVLTTATFDEFNQIYLESQTIDGTSELLNNKHSRLVSNDSSQINYNSFKSFTEFEAKTVSKLHNHRYNDNVKIADSELETQSLKSKHHTYLDVDFRKRTTTR